MKKVEFIDPQIFAILGTTYQVGDYDDGETSFAIVDTPGYETLTIDDKNAEYLNVQVIDLAIKRYISNLNYPAWYFNAGNIQMKNKQAEEIDRLGIRDRYTYSIKKIGVFDRLVTRFTLAPDPDDIYPFPIEQTWDRNQMDAAIDEFDKSNP